MRRLVLKQFSVDAFQNAFFYPGYKFLPPSLPRLWASSTKLYTLRAYKRGFTVFGYDSSFRFVFIVLSLSPTEKQDTEKDYYNCLTWNYFTERSQHWTVNLSTISTEFLWKLLYVELSYFFSSEFIFIPTYWVRLFSQVRGGTFALPSPFVLSVQR